MPAGSRQRPVQGAEAKVLWLSDFTYVATWTGFVYVAFMINAYARRIVGSRLRARRTPASCSMHWSGAARSTARPSPRLVHHSDRAR